LVILLDDHGDTPITRMSSGQIEGNHRGIGLAW
jgi:hypothetical protein